MKILLANIFIERNRDDWALHFDGLDACVTPVLALDELALHPHFQKRSSFQERDGVQVPVAAPRFSIN